jgi:hypothetical protein
MPVVVTVRAALTLLLLVATAALGPHHADAADVLPDVDVVLVAEVQDAASWLALHQEVLATPLASPKTLRATLPARTGGSRTIDIEQPRFSVSLVTTGGSGQIKVSVSGKIQPALALALVTPFQDAALEIQAGLVVNELWLTYGLSSVPGRLLELHFNRP